MLSPPSRAPRPAGDALARAFAAIVAQCLAARTLAEAWDQTARQIGLTSLNAGLGARRATHDQGVFTALARETREIAGAIRALAGEGLPLARGIARRSIRVIGAARHLDSLRRAAARAAHSARVAAVAGAAEAALDGDRAALAPDLRRLGVIFRELDWHLVRLRTVALYFRIEGGRDQAGDTGFLQTSAALTAAADALEGRGAALADVLLALDTQLATREAPRHA